MDDKKRHTQDKRQAKEEKRQAKLKRQKDKEAQLQRDIAQMKSEIERNKKRSGDSGSGQGKKPKKSTIILIVILVLAVLFFFGGQIFNGAKSLMTDELTTSEFIQAVEQNRVQNVVYNSGEYNVSGSYYPTDTSGSKSAGAFNDAFEALNQGTLGILEPYCGEH